MTDIYAVVEGHLDARLLTVLMQQIGHGHRRLVVRDAGGGVAFWKLTARYNEAGRNKVMIGLADMEQEPCAASAFKQLRGGLSDGFKLRLAVRMLESWIIADRESFASFLGVRVAMLPMNPDAEAHPKRLIVTLAANSRKRMIRSTLLPTNAGAVVGPEYTPTLASFVAAKWDSQRARLSSPSLDRACLRWASI